MPQQKPSLRERHAAQTREAVLDAAYELFTRSGYSGATIGQIAELAGVSVQTIYSSVGNKGELISQLVARMDVTSGGREAWAEVERAESAREILAIGVRVVRNFPEHQRELLKMLEDAASVEPLLREHLEAGQRRHAGAMQALVDQIDRRFGLPDELPAARAGAIAGAITNAPIWWDLADRHGWTYDEIEQWLVEALCQTILGER